jgi:hypothetical protein
MRRRRTIWRAHLASYPAAHLVVDVANILADPRFSSSSRSTRSIRRFRRSSAGDARRAGDGDGELVFHRPSSEQAGQQRRAAAHQHPQDADQTQQHATEAHGFGRVDQVVAMVPEAAVACW